MHFTFTSTLGESFPFPILRVRKGGRQRHAAELELKPRSRELRKACSPGCWVLFAKPRGLGVQWTQRGVPGKPTTS